MFILLYGEDTYRSAQKLKEIKEQFKKKNDPSGLNVISFEGTDFDLEKFNSAAAQSGFLTAKRLIIVKNLLSTKLKQEVQDSLLELLTNLKNSENVFVFREEGQPDKRTKLYKLLAGDKKYLQEFKPLDQAGLNAWVDGYLKDRQATIAAGGKNLLLSFADNNLWQLANELDKLIAYKNNGEITEADVKEIITAKVMENIFGLTDALAVGNKQAGLKLLNEQLAAGLNIQYILTMIIRQFRIIAQLKSLLSQKKTESEIVSQTKLHPFVVKKTLPLVQKFTKDKIVAIYDRLISLDRKYKSTPLPQQTLLELFVMKL
ncbi:MAG TPA: DNA polymerase III subunit delta [Patescibacteria group bacterium]|nr:DNA polymerase III subunit delta [Patescibacteria group bacterium]